MKEYKIEIGKIRVNLSDRVILKIELPIYKFSYDEVTEIVTMLQNKDSKILDSEFNEYKVIDRTFYTGRNNPIHPNDYERFLIFDAVYLSKDKVIKDVSVWIDKLSKSDLIIKL